MALIGCNNFHFAVMTTEDTKTSVPVYDDAKGMTAISGLVKIEVQPQTNSNTLYADNGAYLTANALGEINVNLETADLPLEIAAKLLGHTYNAETKSIVYSVNDTAPYVAIAFAAQKADGSTRFVKLYKGKFSEANDDAQTQGNSVEFKTASISGKFVIRKDTGDWKKVIDAVAGDVDTTSATFFKTVLDA